MAEGTWKELIQRKELRKGRNKMQYNIMDYGAIPDGVTNNQPMIQQAIDACAKTGGTVVIPAGNFLSGTIPAAIHC